MIKKQIELESFYALFLKDADARGLQFIEVIS